MKKICPKCKIEHEKSGKYCSRSCANSRIFSNESREKKSEAAKLHWKKMKPKDKAQKTKELTNLLKEISPNSTENYLKQLFETDWNDVSLWSKRIRVILEQKGRCNRCGISHWIDKRITLEYEHIDGNHNNNARDNVECLCPNCHSLTATWRGRKNGKIQSKVETYLEAMDL